MLPLRQARFAARKKLWAGQTLTEAESRAAEGDPHIVKVLYLAHCTREKGLFDTVAGLNLANEHLRKRRSLLSLRLLVTGNFVTESEKAEFDRLLTRPGATETIQYLGFVFGKQKARVLREADIFCFPTYYENENHPVNLI